MNFRVSVSPSTFSTLALSRTVSVSGFFSCLLAPSCLWLWPRQMLCAHFERETGRPTEREREKEREGGKSKSSLRWIFTKRNYWDDYPSKFVLIYETSSIYYVKFSFYTASPPPLPTLCLPVNFSSKFILMPVFVKSSKVCVLLYFERHKLKKQNMLKLFLLNLQLRNLVNILFWIWVKYVELFRICFLLKFDSTFRIFFFNKFHRSLV